MSSTSETGHYKNVANMETLIITVQGFEASYNPSLDSIKIPAMEALQKKGREEISAVNVALAVYKKNTGERVAAFKPLKKLVTRMLNALKASGVSQQTVDNAKTLVHKLRGKRVKPKLTEEEKKILADQGKQVKEHSSSQMSFDLRLDNFGKLILLLEGVANYKPNEEDLRKESLNLYYDDLKSKNMAAINSYTKLSNARVARNEVLYAENTGIFDVARYARNYTNQFLAQVVQNIKWFTKLNSNVPRSNPIHPNSS